MYKKQRFNPQTMTSYILKNLKQILYKRLLKISLLATITIFASTFLPHRAIPDTYKVNLSDIEIDIVKGALLAEKEIIEAYKICVKNAILSKKLKNIFEKNIKKNLLQISKLNNFLKNSLNKNNEIFDYDFPIEKLKSEADAINFISDLESSIIKSYIDSLEFIEDQNLKKLIGQSIAADSINWAILLSKTGQEEIILK